MGVTDMMPPGKRFFERVIDLETVFLTAAPTAQHQAWSMPYYLFALQESGEFDKRTGRFALFREKYFDFSVTVKSSLHWDDNVAIAEMVDDVSGWVQTEWSFFLDGVRHPDTMFFSFYFDNVEAATRFKLRWIDRGSE